jgi:signal transduction histidine kinase
MAAEQMDRLLQDLLEYGRICSVQLVPVKLLLGRVLESVLKKLSGQIQHTNASVQMEGTFPAVWADAGLLQEVLFNLLSNAFKFVAPPAKPEVRIWAELNGAFVRLWIEDNGIGIPPEHRERIFRIFERLHVFSTFSGTGMGLASAKKAVERMHGSLGVEPNHGTGSRFWLELPTSSSFYSYPTSWPFAKSPGAPRPS